MAENDGKIHISFQEGFSRNYINGFRDRIGGEAFLNSFRVDKGPVKLDMSHYSVEGLEFSYWNLESSKPLVIERLPDQDPGLLHLNLLKEGKFLHAYQDETSDMEANGLSGVFLYNGKFPLEVELPAQTKIKWLSYTFHPNQLGSVYASLLPLFQELFQNDTVAYRSGLSKESEILLSDVFAFQSLPKENVPLIAARAMEIFINQTLFFKAKKENDQGYGLHLDDLELMHAVKKKIIKNIEQSFTIDELSNEFALSATKLKQDFKKAFGTTIRQFYIKSRMDEAFRRLKTGRYTVSEVGYDMGYSNLSKFSEMFKRAKGILPTEVLKVPN